MSDAIEYDEHGRPDPPLDADEPTSLLAFVDHERGTVAWKTRGLGASDFTRRLGPSTMTLGGMLKHLARIEDLWFSQRLHGNDPAPPWDGVEWENDPDWDWRTAMDDPPDQLLAMWQTAVDRSRALVTRALDLGGLDQPAVWIDDWYERSPTLRWILLHVHREYARHVGHIDLLRESIDGLTGE